MTSGQVDLHETAARRRARLRQHVDAAVRDARAVAEIEARYARHEAYDERHRRVGDVTSGEVERLAAVEPTDGVVDAGPVVEGRRQEVLDAGVAHSLRPLQVETDQQRAGGGAQRRDRLPTVASETEVRQTRQPTNEPRQLASTDVRPAEIEMQRLTKHDSDQVLLRDATPAQIDDAPQTTVEAPSVPRLAHGHAARQVGGRQRREGEHPQRSLQDVSCPVRSRHVLRGRANRGRAYGVLLDEGTWLLQRHCLPLPTPSRVPVVRFVVLRRALDVG